MNRFFLIGDFSFCLHIPEMDTDAIRPPTNFFKFEVPNPNGPAEYTYTLRLTDHLPDCASSDTPIDTADATAPASSGIVSGSVLKPAAQPSPVAVRPDILIFRTAHGETRYLGVKGQPGFYACYQEIDDNRATIFLDKSRIASLHIDPVFTSLFALERRMLERNSLIFHCAYVQYRDEAILFSAPSETGKTTQANLWEKYEGSRTVNGDKALIRADYHPIAQRQTGCYPQNHLLADQPLTETRKASPLKADRFKTTGIETAARKTDNPCQTSCLQPNSRQSDCLETRPSQTNSCPSADGIWIADGWPVCGTSEVCHNERTPIRAIVMLRQAPENRVRRLRPSEAFLQVYAQTTINGWDRDSVQRSSALIERLITEIPVYELQCTISEEAVTCLKAALYP